MPACLMLSGLGDTMKSMLRAAALIAAAMSPASAADLYVVPDAYCALAEGSNLMTLPTDAELVAAVITKMDEAVAVADSETWIYSSRPAFVWASEAKVACGKAYGYLRFNFRDEEFINKCDCFHSRMLQYMN